MHFDHADHQVVHVVYTKCTDGLRSLVIPSNQHRCAIYLMQMTNVPLDLLPFGFRYCLNFQIKSAYFFRFVSKEDRNVYPG